jgi:hypothetical protein
MSARKASAGPHRTDRKRGSRVRVAEGVFQRAGKFLISYTDAEGIDHLETLGPIKKRDGAGFTLTEAKAAREKKRVQVKSGDAVAPRRETLNDVAKDFFAMFESLVWRGEASERTLELYRQRHASHIERRSAASASRPCAARTSRSSSRTSVRSGNGRREDSRKVSSSQTGRCAAFTTS